MASPLLEINGVGKSYGSIRALDNVRLSVMKGEMFGLLGPNGAGKTTLLSIVSCLLDADEGEARLDGQRLRMQDREVRRQIGIVPQELAIYGELTARENLAFFGELYNLSESMLKRRVDEVLAAIGLVEQADRRAETFSGGMKRRLNLGAALMHEPRLLLLDEPTTGVDPQSRNHLFEEIRRVNQLGVTVIYTSHYMEEVESLCTRVGIMDRGRLVACDTLPAMLQTIPGIIRCRLAQSAQPGENGFDRLTTADRVTHRSSMIEIECRDLKRTLVELVSMLNEKQWELANLELKEPNLERVFLHLTGRELRDE